MFCRACRGRGGFTLAEMMVVVSIIIILVAMLVPFLGGVRERGYVALCQNNLEKIGQAMAISSSKVGGRLPTGSSWVGERTIFNSYEVSQRMGHQRYNLVIGGVVVIIRVGHHHPDRWRIHNSRIIRERASHVCVHLCICRYECG